jgi:glycerol kinase
MRRFLLSLDQGTTGSTALVVGEDGTVLGKATTEFAQHFPNEGWVEHDLEEIWASLMASLDRALRAAKVDARDCAGIGITNQRETTVIWERSSLRPIHRAIVWQDRRTTARCEELRSEGYEARVRARTGLVLDPYFSATKIAWILDNVDGARARAERGELAFGTIDSWLLARLTAGGAHKTDVTNASRTSLLDLRSCVWDAELLEIFRVPAQLLPEVCSSSEIYGTTRGVPGLVDGTPIAGIAGDQQAALFGQTCFAKGDAKCTYGTGAFMLMNTGSEIVPSKSGMLTTIAWKVGDEVVYALEGSSFIAGAAVQWLRDGLGIISSAREIEALAASVDDSGEVSFVPALSGLGAPYWEPRARGLISGLSRGTTKGHLARATLEGIALQIADILGAMEADSGLPLSRLRVDGGASANALLMQYQSDILDVVVDRPANVETTALGAAYLAGLAVGVYAGASDIKRAHRIERSFHPAMDASERDTHLEKWRRAIVRTRTT